MSGYLLVRAGGRPYALPLAAVLEVIDHDQSVPVPGSHPAVRGVSPVRGRLVARVHLGAFVGGTTPPAGAGGTVVLVRGAERTMALEVDDADAILREAPLPVPPEWDLPFATGVARHAGDLVPVLDIEGVLARLASAGAVR